METETIALIASLQQEVKFLTERVDLLAKRDNKNPDALNFRVAAIEERLNEYNRHSKQYGRPISQI